LYYVDIVTSSSVAPYNQKEFWVCKGWDRLVGKVTGYILNDWKQIEVEVRFFNSLLRDWMSVMSPTYSATTVKLPYSIRPMLCHSVGLRVFMHRLSAEIRVTVISLSAACSEAPVSISVIVMLTELSRHRK
jgi:hypothetical protein